MSKEYLLNVKNLSCERNYKVIFKKLSFILYPGNIILVDGENGAGKTSLLLCVADVLAYTGKILVKSGIPNL